MWAKRLLKGWSCIWGQIDVSRKNDPNQVILEITTALGKVHKEYPEAEIAFSSIIPRRGKSEAIKKKLLIQTVKP